MVIHLVVLIRMVLQGRPEGISGLAPDFSKTHLGYMLVLFALFSIIINEYTAHSKICYDRWVFFLLPMNYGVHDNKSRQRSLRTPIIRNCWYRAG